ncbi:uncharacterized protein LOC132697780 isoform X2 [Cylas formicarius]|uniref:uncharacterized protein LOC132697780 isoform X2 n=1 Tax=Cylas formicarius TaxID=197179 RepID=UPI002958D2AC|nr:uncharacterized protein LOC132697780 isoform X2 [Cylas formicarius]
MELRYTIHTHNRLTFNFGDINITSHSLQLTNMWGQIPRNGFFLISSVTCIVIPFYMWKSLWQLWRTLQKENDEILLFHKRHNCVVIYQPKTGLSGWPRHNDEKTPDINSRMIHLCEPFTYFIRTAKESLCIAFMVINIKHTESCNEDIKKLLNEGVKFQFFVAPTSAMDTIMHHKFMVKDAVSQTKCLCTGSMNLTGSSFFNNYESMVFSCNPYLVDAFKNHFEECWDNLKMDNDGLINKIILRDARLL